VVSWGMKRGIGLVSILALLGCGDAGNGMMGPPRRVPLVAVASLEDVSPAATWLTFTSADGLSVLELSTGSIQRLSSDGFAAGFVADDLLLFQTLHTSTSPWNGLHLWRPEFANSVRITAEYLGTRWPVDGSFILVEDMAASARPDLKLVKPSECTPSGCPSTTLASSPDGYALSPYGHQVAWLSASQLFVHDTETNQTQPLTATSVGSYQVAVSPHGLKVATVESSPSLGLAVFDATTGARLAWATPIGLDLARGAAIAFLDDDVLLVNTRHPQQPATGFSVSSLAHCDALSCSEKGESGASCNIWRLVDGTPRWTSCTLDCSRCQPPTTFFDLEGKSLLSIGIASPYLSADLSVLAYVDYIKSSVVRVSLPSNTSWEPRRGVHPVVITPSMSMLYRTAADTSGRLVLDDGAQTTDLAGSVARFIARKGTVWYEVTATDPQAGVVELGIYSSPAP
jgi:hypothetical protein